MDQAYSFKHWASTLLLAPFLYFLYGSLFYSEEIMVSFIQLYILLFFFSIMFSIPVFAIHGLILSVLISKHSTPAITKMILIAWTIIGIFATFYVVHQSFDNTIILAYTSSAIISGLFLRIKKGTDGDIFLPKRE